MNGPFQVAQASDAGIANTNTAPRIFRLTKPLGDQAVVINLGYDQNVKVDLSGIANEKITLVHVGEKLIVLFDNKSTITVEPFFELTTRCAEQPLDQGCAGSRSFGQRIRKPVSDHHGPIGFACGRRRCW